MKWRGGKATLKGIRSHPARGAWIEISTALQAGVEKASHPARGAWIEIDIAAASGNRQNVAPRKGCVD